MRAPLLSPFHNLRGVILILSSWLTPGCSGNTPPTPQGSDGTNGATPAATPATAAPAADGNSAASPLLWKLNDGDRLHWVFDSTVELQAPRGDEVVRGKLGLVMDFDAAVRQSGGDPARIEIAAARIRSESTMPDLEFQYDSQTEDDAGADPDGGNAARFMLDPWLKLKLAGAIDLRGAIGDLQVSDEVQGLAEGGAGFQGMNILLDADGLNSLYVGGFVLLPEDPLSGDAGWTGEITTNSPQGTMRFTHTARYAGRETVDGRELEKFDLTVVSSVTDQPEYRRRVVRIEDGAGSGVLYFDAAAGHVVESRWDCTIKMIFGGGEAEGEMRVATRSTIGRVMPGAEVEAFRQEIERGWTAFREEQDLFKARDVLYDALRELAAHVEDEKLAGREPFQRDSKLMRDAFRAMAIWQHALTLLGEPIPDHFSLQSHWDADANNALRTAAEAWLQREMSIDVVQ